MKRIVFNKYCSNCKCLVSFEETNAKGLCSKVSLFGFSFFGGVKYYTFREVLVSLGIRRQAIIGKCTSCGTLKIGCPHCGEVHDVVEGKKEKCKSCAKPFYVCT